MVFGHEVGAGEPDARLQNFENGMKTSVLDMGKDVFTIRQAAHARLAGILNEYHDIRNPLPSSAYAIINPSQQGLNEEQRKRLEIIQEFERQSRKCKPGRIGCPEAAGTTLHRLLEQQFGLPINSEDDEILHLSRGTFHSPEGQSSTKAMMEICKATASFPYIMPEGIWLQRLPANSVLRANDDVLTVEHSVSGRRVQHVFCMPDKGILLDAENTNYWTLPTTSVHIDGLHHWSSACNKGWSPSIAASVKDNQITAYLGTEIATGTLKPGESKYLELEPHQLIVHSVEEKPNGGYMTCVRGNVHIEKRWSKLFPYFLYREDMFTYQLAAAIGFQAMDESGNALPTAVSPLLFSQRQFDLYLHTEKKPAHFIVRAPTTIERKTLTLP